MLDLPLRQMLGHALFVTGCGVDRKPFWFEYRILRKLRQKAIIRSKSPLPNAAHSLIVLSLGAVKPIGSAEWKTRFQETQDGLISK
jgi:hypothetical protein